MRRADFDFDLPEELIAQAPLAARSGSRLLRLDAATGAVADRMMTDFPAMLNPGDLLVFNNTRVIAARLRGRKSTGGKIEVLVERMLGDHDVLAQIRGGASLREGASLYFDAGVSARVGLRHGDFHCLRFDGERTALAILEAIGSMPLPPYIARADGAIDRQRYQTIFAARDGAVAAPTAGLHFDEALIRRIRDAGIETAEITLHVGAGTFQPVRSEDLAAHRMHAEWMEVDGETCARIGAARARGGRVIAVGTTVVRALETAARAGEIAPFSGETSIFITPGFRFRVIDALLTNFHMPRTTLLMLVCALAGTETVLSAYRHAVAGRYRFFSYGDAMFIS